MYEWKGEEAPPEFDASTGAAYVGKYILLGVTYLDPSGKELEKVQMHGVIKTATAEEIVVDLRGVYEGKTWSMPPDLRAISEARPGKYMLRATGEIVTDPDLVSTWTVVKPTLH